MALLNPGKIGVYAETQGDRDTHNFAPGVMLKGLNDIGLRWYYTYANRSPNSFEATIDNSGTLSNPNSIQTSIIQLPSIWNADPAYQNSTTLNFAKANGGLIITYNEPWNGFNNWWPGNPMTPTQALDAWPTLMALGNRLASPSISYSSFTQSNDWLAEFMAGVASRGYRVDVINVHYYSSSPNSAVSDFQNYLQGVHNLYNKPIVITEWALADWGNQNGSATATFSPSQQADFAEAACMMLDGLSFVERHSWYNSAEGVGYTWQNSGLLNADGTPTIVGQRFANILNPGVITPPPPVITNNKDIRGTKAGTPNSYFEVVFNTLKPGTNFSGVGLSNLSQSLSVGRPGDPNAVMYYATGYAEWPGSGKTTNWASYGVGDVIGVYLKFQTVEFYKNGTLVGTATVEPAGNLYPLLSFASGLDSATANFGASPMSFLPAGANSWDGGAQTTADRRIFTGQVLPPVGQAAAGVITGVAGSFLNSNDKSQSVTLSNNNLTVSSNSNRGMVRGTKPGFVGGYFEFTFSTIVSGSSTPGVGVANITQPLAGYMGDPNGVGYFSGGYVEWPGSGYFGNFGSYVAGDVIGVYLKTSSIEFYKNGALAGIATTLPNGTLYPAILVATTGDVGTVNFGATNFAYLPAGATAWNATLSGATRTAQATQTLGQLGQVIGTGGGGAAGIILNPADKFTDIVLTNANLTATYTTSRAPGNVNVRGSTPGNPDNYFEVTFSTLVSGTSTAGVGVANLSLSLTIYPGNPNGVGWFKDGYHEWPGGGGDNSWPTFAAGDVLGVFRRVTSVQFYKNGTLVGTATTLPSGDLYPIISPANNTDAATVNFGASAFSFAPSGALAWGTTGTGGPRAAQAAQTLPGIGQTVIASGPGGSAALSWDPAAMGSGITLSNGNLTASITSSSATQLRTTVGYSFGKHYAELTLTAVSGSSVLGIEDSSIALNNYPGSDEHGLGWYPNSWAGYNGNWVLLNAYSSGIIIGFAYDATLKRAWFSLNGTWMGDPVAGTGYIDMSSPGLTGPAYVMFGGVAGDSATINFGASGFAFTPPTGFSSP